jgi:hypothetical protein
LKEIVTFSREHYNTTFSKNVPFLCISHDGWDSLEHDVLGVSLNFIVPVHWKVINVAVGLKRIRSKKSIDTCNAILLILRRYANKVYYYLLFIILTPIIFRFGIYTQDIFRGINDTTNSAKLTGTLISEGRTPENAGTTCHMHTQELVLQHALGIRRRTRKGLPWDQFPPGHDLKVKVKKLCMLIMNKHDKNRFKKYVDYCKTFLNVDVRKLVVPNDTRVSGIFHMFESVLRSYKCLTLYMTGCVDKEKDYFKECVLTQVEWQLMAELHAVMKVSNILAMTFQKQSVDSNCFSYYSVAYARYIIESAKSFKVIEVSHNYTAATPVSKIPTITLLINQLQPDTQLFITRLIKEFNLYFRAPDSDQVKMMIFHPVMAWRGLE